MTYRFSSPVPVTRTCMQMEKNLLDYDENSVITTVNQTSDKKEVFKGVEVRMHRAHQ